MNDKFESMLKKVEALLAKAESTNFSEESEALIAKAQELMTTYQISEAMLGKSESRGKPSSVLVNINNPYPREKVMLLNSIALNNQCKCVILKGRNGTKVHLFGYGQDIELVQMMFASLMMQMIDGMWNAIDAKHPYESTKAWKSSFFMGFQDVVYKRLGEARKNAEEQVVGSALVLRDKSSEVEEVMNEEYPSLGKSKPPASSSYRGMSAGRAAGARADIGLTRMKGSSKQLTG